MICGCDSLVTNKVWHLKCICSLQFFPEATEPEEEQQVSGSDGGKVSTVVSSVRLLLLLTVPNNIRYCRTPSTATPPRPPDCPLYWREPTACELLATKNYLITEKIDSGGQDTASGSSACCGMRELYQNINMCVNIFVTQNILTCEAKFFSFLKNLS